jgi:hypothetical protein
MRARLRTVVETEHGSDDAMQILPLSTTVRADASSRTTVSPCCVAKAFSFAMSSADAPKRCSSSSRVSGFASAAPASIFFIIWANCGSSLRRSTTTTWIVSDGSHCAITFEPGASVRWVPGNGCFDMVAILPVSTGVGAWR